MWHPFGSAPSQCSPVQHYYSSILEAWQFRISARLAERQEFRSAEFEDIRGSLQLLNSSYLRKEIKCCREPYCVEWFGMASFLVRPRRKKFRVGFVVVRMVMSICFGNAAC